MNAERLEPLSTVVQPEPSGVLVNFAARETVSTVRKDKESSLEPGST
jgi:hypothetical protein